MSFNLFKFFIHSRKNWLKISGRKFLKRFTGDVYECQIIIIVPYEGTWIEREKVNERKNKKFKKIHSMCAPTWMKCGRHKNDVFMNDYKFMSYLLHHHIHSISSFSISWAAIFEPSSTWCHVLNSRKIDIYFLISFFFIHVALLALSAHKFTMMNIMWACKVRSFFPLSS